MSQEETANIKAPYTPELDLDILSQSSDISDLDLSQEDDTDFDVLEILEENVPVMFSHVESLDDPENLESTTSSSYHVGGDNSQRNHRLADSSVRLELAVAAEENLALEELNHKLRQQLDSSKSEISNLNSQLKTQKSQNDKLTQHYKILTAQLESTRVERDQVLEKRFWLQKRNEELDKQVSEMREYTEKLSLDDTSSDSTSSSTSSQMYTKNTDNSSANETIIAGLKLQVAGLQQQLAEVSEQNRVQREKYSQFELVHVDVKYKYANSLAQIEDWESKLDLANQQNEKLVKALSIKMHNTKRLKLLILEKDKRIKRLNDKLDMSAGGNLTVLGGNVVK